MKLCSLTVAVATAFSLCSIPVQATTVDFTGINTFNYDDVSQNYGDSSEADLSYRSLNGGNNWGQTATQLADHAEYWHDANYSGDQAIFSVANGNKLEVNLAAGAGLVFTSISFQLGSYPNVNRTIDYRIYDAGWNLLDSAVGALVNGAGGLTITLALLNTTGIHLQLGDDWDVGVNSITYETARVGEVPLPGAVLLLGSGLLGLAGLGLRRKAA